MKNFGLALLIAATLLLVACGNDVKNDPSGTWTFSLTPTQDASVGTATSMSFTDTLATNDNQSTNANTFSGSVSASNLTVVTNNGCLANSASQTAYYVMDTKGNTFSMSVKTPIDANSFYELNMMGTLTNNVISGNWSLSPSAGIDAGCTGSGTFTMQLVSGSGFLPKHG